MPVPLFDKILIANRGEIACRVMRTCRKLGIATVAVYSDADQQTRHVRLADEAVHIGAPPPEESYLDGDRIIAAAQRTGAQAIHPGYGFLAENANFAAACASHGFVFIGPPAQAIRAMGSKSAAKELMEKSGVPLTPGYHGSEQGAAFLARQAEALGYPVLIKASAGGGGKGMRRVDQAADFAAALESCQRESQAAFGDARVLIERYVLRPRHVEIQVFGDRYGKVVHLFERDCSMQRRHQKVLEEAPAPGMTPPRRAQMGEAAVKAAKAVGYVGAGTVEFIMDPQGEFYFMEMNTRLQVEHAVTEMVTGLDLVEWQLRVAAGEPLPDSWNARDIRGHAIEARIYAEDPDRGFLPSVGTLLHLATPAQSVDVRLDTGVEQGDAITPYYDPMIAKLIVWGESREQARRRLRDALSQFHIVGVANNVDFLSWLVDSPAFTAGEVDTGFIERERAVLPVAGISADSWALAALAILLHERRSGEEEDSRNDSNSPWNASDGWRLNGSLRRELPLRQGEQELRVVAEYLPGGFRLSAGHESWRVTGRLDGTALDAEIEGRTVKAEAVLAAGRVHLFLAGRSVVFAQVQPLAAAAEHSPQADLRAPMPGRVVSILLAPGATVKKGAPILILEAMKMEHTVTAPRDGRISKFRCAQGTQVKEGEELVEFEEAG
jgi:3-methylcrotonyl-CoA carboxylase alpha subunit